MKKIGLLTGREKSFPDALIDAIGRLADETNEAVVAEYARIDVTNVEEPPAYDVLVDRISHDVRCYQPVLKLAALAGTHVVNNPFWRIADDKALGTALAKKLGIAVPKTYVIPSKSYSDEVTPESLHNLRFPLDWDTMGEDLGFPMYLKPHWGGGFRDVYRVEDIQELWATYDRTDQHTMIAQEAIEWTQYVRCFVIGFDEVRVMCWDPRLPHAERYTGAPDTMPALSEERLSQLSEQATKLCRALGYEMNTVEFAIRGGVPYAIDFMNSAPDFDISSLGPEAFEWVVQAMAKLLVKLAHTPKQVDYRWDSLLAGKLGLSSRGI